MIDWDRYFEESAKKPLHPFLQKLEPHLPDAGFAVDLGCGVGTATKWLIDKGWRVLAIDVADEAIRCTRERVGDSDRVEMVQADILKFDPVPCDLLLCMFVTFFLPKETVVPTLTKWLGSIRTGGMFCGQILGPKDDWATAGMSYLSDTQVHELCKGFQIVEHERVCRLGKDMLGNEKQWDIHHLMLCAL